MSLKPRRLNTELVQFMDDDLFEPKDSYDAYGANRIAFEEEDGMGGMRNFVAEKSRDGF